MMREVIYMQDGSYVLREGDRELALNSPVTPESLTAACVEFFGPDLSMPDEIPMGRVRLFLIATNRLTEIKNYLNSLPEPNKSMANSEFEYAPNFVTGSALGRSVQAALGLSDADYAEACRNMDTHVIEDYGSPKPTFLATIVKFFKGS